MGHSRLVLIAVSPDHVLFLASRPPTLLTIPHILLSSLPLSRSAQVLLSPGGRAGVCTGDTTPPQPIVTRFLSTHTPVLGLRVYLPFPGGLSSLGMMES